MTTTTLGKRKPKNLRCMSPHRDVAFALSRRRLSSCCDIGCSSGRRTLPHYHITHYLV
ncbi:hypothetical protein ES288_A04G059600v1 [Gossypium darwinii]|uniref:Uncharacterized protein n=1 Tax=Gossypium darwinii TaxID=34276 RepID=A0A5D2GV79_GOSDA|nr:hypothetical protein ES288_A04G059600v1 [Gossypium darwinii]